MNPGVEGCPEEIPEIVEPCRTVAWETKEYAAPIILLPGQCVTLEWPTGSLHGVSRIYSSDCDFANGIELVSPQNGGRFTYRAPEEGPPAVFWLACPVAGHCPPQIVQVVAQM